MDVRWLVALVFVFLLLGCSRPMSDSEKLLSDSAKKASSLHSYTIEYRRVVASYTDPNQSIYVVPETRVVKYKKGGMSRWDTIDWLNNTSRLYKVQGGYYLCSLNSTWSCSKTDESKMQEFLGFYTQNPEASVARAVSESALILGPAKEDVVLERKSKCLAIEIHPEKFSTQDWDEFVMGSVGEVANDMGGLKAWQCLDEETGIKTELILNYKGQVNGELRTVEINLKASAFDPAPALDDSMFELPG